MKVHKLNEVRLNTHQTHLESLVTLGKDGLNELNSHIQKFLNMLEGNNELTLMSKIDGAPSVFMWHKLAGYPDNSIALKSFTSGPNTALSSDEQVDQRYGDRPDMAEKLKQCLKLAKYIPDGQAWQGDCLFTKNDLKEEEINGTGYITFHPNKIVYAFSEDNPGYNDVKNADLGIAFHTIYTIDKDGNKVQSFEVDNSDIKAPKNFYLLFHEMDTKDRKKDFNVDKFNQEFNELKSLEQELINDPNYEDLVTNKSFIDYWNTFENTELADKKQVNINAGTVIKDLTDYIKDKKEKEYDKKLSTLKSDQGREKAKEKYDRDLLELEDLIKNNKDTIINLVNTLNKAADIKMIMWNGLNKTKDNFSTFYKSRTKGFVPANREGISMSDKDGNLVKIVDRSEFSSNNRNPDYLAGFEHESLDLHEDIDIDKLDIKLKPALEKFLGDKKKEFIETIVKMILDHTAYDYFNLGVYRDDMYPEDHLDANGKPIQAKLRKVHNFWLDKFGLDTSKRGVGSAIDSAITSIDWAIDDTDEYKDTLDWDDTKKLPEDEQFKIRLFYDWDVDVRKNFWGEYDDDDPITQMSFKEYLEYLLKEGNYSGHEKDLIKDMIEEIKDGHGYFEEHDVDEEMATQRSDMGSFNKPIFNKKKLTLKEDSDKTAVVAVGRMNPPTIGHAALVKALANIGSKYGVKAKLFLTHTSNNQKNPLSYESKLRWANKAFGDSVEVVKTDARSILDYLSELYNEGYNKLVYVGGGGRIGGDEDVTKNILRYNGQPDRTGKLLYNFDDIKFEDSGSREIPYEGAEQSSATHVRKLVAENNFDEFKKYVPFNERDAFALYKELRYALKGKEEAIFKECMFRENMLREATRLTKSKYTPEVQNALDKELNKIDTKLDAPDRNKGAKEYKQDQDDYTGLFVKQSSDSGVVYSEKDINKLFPNGDQINKELAELEISVNGADYKISSTGSSVLGEDSFSSEETTIYQEAISGLILAGRIDAQDVKSYLKESDDIFRYINVMDKESPSFKSKWLNFINKWGSTFNIEQAQKSTFIDKANSILKGDVTSADILHPGVKSPYSAKAGILLSGADTFDKSDVYYCTGDTDQILDTMLSFRKNKDIKGYVQFMVDNSDKIIGVSLKKISKTLRAEWDIPPKNPSEFSNVYWPKTDALTQGLVFKVGDNSYLLAIRPNSKKAGDKGTMEWKEVGGSAQMGKAVTPVRKYLGDKFFSAISKVMVDRNYIQACKMMLNKLTGKDAEPGNVYELSDDGKVLISKIFNDGCGFNSTDDSGVRMSAPYIKVF